MRIWSHLGFANGDGTYGRKLFYEARGYSVTDCYNQQTDNITAGGFSFANYKAQIDAGYPVLLNLAGHSIVGVGYADPNTVYLNDTWDHATHQMTWGGSYSVPPMELQAVSVVNPVVSHPQRKSICHLSSRTIQPPGSWTTIVSTDFEGAWPGAWAVSDESSADGGRVLLGQAELQGVRR